MALLALPGMIGGAEQVSAAPVANRPITRDDIDHWAAAWNTHDIKRVLALFSPNVRIDQPSDPQFLDDEGARGFFTVIFRAYSDFHIKVTQTIIEGTNAVSVDRVTGTWRGIYVDPATGRSTPGNGRTFDHPGAMVIHYAPDHPITLVSIYRDQLTVDRQLGVVPKP
ncbi:ester cyclase [Dyella sp.]|uniref:ester cyclase n=1 Tax=Dyella sp. TaxID=1869338 RepID=UPI002ED1BABD